MNDILKSIIASVLAAAVSSGCILYATTQTNTAFIERLTSSTDKLGDAVTELRIAVGQQNERFVTKDELHLTVKELREELKNGR